MRLRLFIYNIISLGSVLLYNPKPSTMEGGVMTSIFYSAYSRVGRFSIFCISKFMHLQVVYGSSRYSMGEKHFFFVQKARRATHGSYFKKIPEGIILKIKNLL